MSSSFKFSKGWTYIPWEDRDTDCIKIWHDVVSPQGKKLTVDWDPYVLMTKEDLEVWVELGCPERIGAGPLDREDLNTIDLIQRVYEI